MGKHIQKIHKLPKLPPAQGDWYIETKGIRVPGSGV